MIDVVNENINYREEKPYYIYFIYVYVASKCKIQLCKES